MPDGTDLPPPGTENMGFCLSQWAGSPGLIENPLNHGKKAG